MSVYMAHEKGPCTGEGPARNDILALAAGAIRRYNIAGLLPRAQAIQDVTDAEMHERMKNIALYADKSGIAQRRVCSCIPGSLTQSGLAGKSGAVS